MDFNSHMYMHKACAVALKSALQRMDLTTCEKLYSYLSLMVKKKQNTTKTWLFYETFMKFSERLNWEIFSKFRKKST